MQEYVLGTSDHELDRLEQQHHIWLEITQRVLDRLGVEPGMTVLDLGCGPGFVLELLRERVGDAGRVVGVDESPRWIERIRAVSADRGWTNVEAIQSRIEDFRFEGRADRIFLRWVLSFLPEPGAVLRTLASALAPDGRLGVMDYNHHGVSLFPECDSFRAAIRATRAMYAGAGGDTFVMGTIPAHFREAELETVALDPYVMAGGPGSPAFHWADIFFPYHVERMLEAGLMTSEERDAFLVDWEAHRSNPDALFYSPIVAAAVARPLP